MTILFFHFQIFLQVINEAVVVIAWLENATIDSLQRKNIFLEVIIK